MRFAFVTLVLMPPALWAQVQEHKPVFEAASIKMTALKGGGSHSHENDTPGLLRASMTLKAYIMTAYSVKPFQVTGGPNWIDESTYDIVAKLERPDDEDLPANLNPRQRGAARDARTHAALQTLLAERFQLKIHHETKEMPSYTLTVVKSGFKLKETPDSTGCGTSSRGDGTTQKFTGTCIDMTTFASFLARHSDRPVSDMTHIAGHYTFTLEWTPNDLKNVAASDQPALPSLFTVIQEQLGLRLEPQKAPVDVIVVESAERPSEN